MSEELNEDKVPLPWNPNEQCELNEKIVPTKKDDDEEQDGTLFNRECDDLDNTIVKRKDRFIDCVDIPDVPKAKLLKEDWPIVPFPGVPEVEIPKRLMAHLLSCCLKDRTAGFDFDITQELDGNSKAQISNWADENNPITTTVAIQLGTTGYLLIGLNLKPQLCFCDESCGDEDYIHITANLDAVYHDEIDDHIHDNPDLVITDEQLTKLISEHGGGGGGNPLCAQKLFGTYIGPDITLQRDTTDLAFVPYDKANITPEDIITTTAAPYLNNFRLLNGAVYKLEYFCEYNAWYVTDGQCANVATQYAYPSYMVITAEDRPNQTFSKTLYLWDGTIWPEFDDMDYSVAPESEKSPSEVFVDGLTLAPLNNSYQQLRCSFQLKEGALGEIIYNLSVFYKDRTNCDSRDYKLIFRVKDTTIDDTVVNEEP